MAASLLKGKVEDSLKDQAALAFENLEIDTPTAVRIFLKRAVMENGIPFRMTLPRSPYNAERGYRAMVEISEGAERHGISDMSLDEINAEIEASRAERRAFLSKNGRYDDIARDSTCANHLDMLLEESDDRAVILG